jgi:hypothetical protein
MVNAPSHLGANYQPPSGVHDTQAALELLTRSTVEHLANAHLPQRPYCLSLPIKTSRTIASIFIPLPKHPKKPNLLN